jgi:hypothetical protein
MKLYSKLRKNIIFEVSFHVPKDSNNLPNQQKKQKKLDKLKRLNRPDRPDRPDQPDQCQNSRREPHCSSIASISMLCYHAYEMENRDGG